MHIFRPDRRTKLLTARQAERCAHAFFGSWGGREPGRPRVAAAVAWGLRQEYLETKEDETRRYGFLGFQLRPAKRPCTRIGSLRNRPRKSGLVDKNRLSARNARMNKRGLK